MKRMLALMLMVLVGLPWAVMPAWGGSACAMPGARAASCSVCAGEAPSNDGTPVLRIGCCSYAPRASWTPDPANGVSLTPKPNLSPEALAPAWTDAAAIAAAPRSNAPPAARSAPPPSPPTETTHLRN
jgi:hypothetical protein